MKVKNRIVIYCRVSSDEQKKNDTIESQVDTLKTYLELHRDEYEFIGQYLDNGISGTVPFNLREGGKQLLKDAKEKHNFDTILVYRVDRFGRDTRTGLNAIEEIVTTGVQIQSLSEPFDLNTPTGRFQFIMYLNMAELERNNILDRMFIGATRAAKQGRWLGGIVPYGYYLDKNNFLNINKNEADIVRYIFYLYTEERKTLLDIAIYLNSLGISKYTFSKGSGKHTSNTIWNATTIGRIIANTTYKGIHSYGKNATRRKEIIEREVPIIIPEYVFNKAQDIRKENNIIKDTGVSKRVFLLRGLITCAKCGKHYQGITYKTKKNVYSCASKRIVNKRLKGTKCNNVNINANDIEDYIWNTCKDIMINFKDYTIDKVEDGDSDLELNKIKIQLDKVDEEKNKLLKLFRKDLIDENELEKQLHDINKEKKSLEKIFNELSNKEKLKKDTKNLISEYDKKLEYYRNKIGKLTCEDKMKVIRILVNNITIDTIIEDGKAYPSVIVEFVNVFIPTLKHSKIYVDHNKTKITDNQIRGNNLAKLRIDAGMSKIELSEKLNISSQTIARIENGKCPTLYYYSLYCKYFNKEPYTFLEYNKLKEDTYRQQVEKLMYSYCCKSTGDLSENLGLHRGGIDNCVRFGYKNIQEIIANELNKLKKRY